MSQQPGPALFVTSTALGRATSLSVWTADGHHSGRSNDVGMAAAIAKAVVAEHQSALVSGDDGRCVLVHMSATTGLAVEPLAYDDVAGWPTSLSRVLQRLTSQPTLPPSSRSTGGNP
ncbi:MAG: hypothetical protein Q8K63_05970 [Acidimicrobiales bacterium]|nr:hypothetical protein [Acidimicrobiales bacterium]